jgi:enterochelin esterase family protein
MPGYVPPAEIVQRKEVPRGSLDTLLFSSDTLGRTHPVIIYTPPGYAADTVRYESIWVTDGGEHLTLNLMGTVLDNLIHDGRIRPVVGIFVDPRTDPADSRTSRRMEDYALSRPFLNALIAELRPLILKEYRIATEPAVIMGSSLGGLFSTYASVTRPDIFSGCAAQSPAYWWNNGELFDLVEARRPTTVRFYIDTGTIMDAREESFRMSQLLRRLGCEVSYAEYPEGHNPVNWRARIDEILEYFFPAE